MCFIWHPGRPCCSGLGHSSQPLGKQVRLLCSPKVRAHFILLPNRRGETLLERQLKAKDQRIKLMSEILAGIKVDLWAGQYNHSFLFQLRFWSSTPGRCLLWAPLMLSGVKRSRCWKLFLFSHCYHLLSLFKVLKFFFIFTLLSPTIIFQGAEVDRQALGSRQLHLLLRSLPHDSRNFPHLHIQVETDWVLNPLNEDHISLLSDPEHNKLTADLIFTSLSLFNLVRTPLTLFPFALMDTIKLFVRSAATSPSQIMQLYIICCHSVKRIKDFLNAEELEEFSSSDEKVRST